MTKEGLLPSELVSLRQKSGLLYKIEHTISEEKQALEKQMREMVEKYKDQLNLDMPIVKEYYRRVCNNPLDECDKLAAAILETQLLEDKSKLPAALQSCDYILASYGNVFGVKKIQENPPSMRQVVYSLCYGEPSFVVDRNITTEKVHNEKLADALTCLLMSCELIHSVYLIGSTVYDDMVPGYSDVDMHVLVDTDDHRKLADYKVNFNLIAEKLFGMPAHVYHYQEHFDAFFSPCQAITGVKQFEEYCILPVPWTLFNIKYNSKLLYGEDLRPRIPVEYSSELIDEWLGMAPRYHLENVFSHLTAGNTYKAAAALSRAILQTARGICWKEYKETSASYSKITDTLVKNKHPFRNLAIFALDLRKKQYKTDRRTIEKNAKQAKKDILRELKKYL